MARTTRHVKNLSPPNQERQVLNCRGGFLRVELRETFSASKFDFVAALQRAAPLPAHRMHTACLTWLRWAGYFSGLAFVLQ